MNFNQPKPSTSTRNNILFRCGYCNYKLSKSTHHRKWKRITGEGFKKIYTYLNCENDQCNKVINKRLEVEKYYIYEQSEDIDDTKEFTSYNKLISDFKKNIKLVIRGRLKVSNLKYYIDHLKAYEEYFQINSPKNRYHKIVEVKNDFNKILTPM